MSPWNLEAPKKRASTILNEKTKLFAIHSMFEWKKYPNLTHTTQCAHNGIEIFKAKREEKKEEEKSIEYMLETGLNLIYFFWRHPYIRFHETNVYCTKQCTILMGAILYLLFLYFVAWSQTVHRLVWNIYENM